MTLSFSFHSIPVTLTQCVIQAPFWGWVCNTKIGHIDYVAGATRMPNFMAIGPGAVQSRFAKTLTLTPNPNPKP